MAFGHFSSIVGGAWVSGFRRSMRAELASSLRGSICTGCLEKHRIVILLHTRGTERNSLEILNFSKHSL